MMIEDGKEPVAGLSAASSCIRFSLTTTATSSSLSPSSSLVCFRPVFTHQCFQEECIVGWRPLLTAEDQSRDIYRTWKESDDDDGGDGNEYIHKSYNQLELTDERMDVHIILAPSCDTCRIEIRTESHTSNNNNIALSEPLPKKSKTTVSFQESESNKTHHLRMKMNIHDIVQKMSLALPPIGSVTVNGTNRNELVPPTTTTTNIVMTNIDSDDNNWKCLFKPYGTVLKTYHRQMKSSKEESSNFIITMANGSDDPNVVTYHNSIQPLSRWFIETADNVNLNDDSRGQWKVMYLFRSTQSCCTVDNNKIDVTKLMNNTGDYDDNHDNSRQKQVLEEERLQPQLEEEGLSTACTTVVAAPVELVGYITLLHIHSPFRKPKSGIIVKICQVLLLPPYHNAGHGTEMIKCIYEYADNTSAIEEEATTSSLGRGMEIVEINVEDPAPAFVALRQSVDYARFTANEKLKPYYLECSPTNIMGRLSNDVTKLEEFFIPTPDDKIVIIAELLRITKRQAMVMDEIWMLQHILTWKKNFVTKEQSACCNELIEQVETQYRLMVKKSIRTLRLEELGACDGGKEGQKALLAKWFDETMCQYRRTLRL
jgi:histone acetyltransferase 1